MTYILPMPLFLDVFCNFNKMKQPQTSVRIPRYMFVPIYITSVGYGLKYFPWRSFLSRSWDITPDGK
jgi:hypothetical protein